VLGGSGYAGQELARLLAGHPELELAAFMGAREGSGRHPAEEAASSARARAAEPLDWARVGDAEGVFLCTPHAASAPLAARCLELGVKVVDLSADFRLRDAALYERVYEHRHPRPELLGEAVYGLTERARERVAKARLVANPGCYPTSVLLPLLALLDAGLVDRARPVVADCKSGLSGAGKTPSERTHFGNVYENFCAYGVGSHRHGPEIRQECGLRDLVFTPHLLPAFRGILSTLYVAAAAGARAADLRAALARAYAGERFVRILERGLPDLRAVQLTNECRIGLADATDSAESGGTVVLVSVLDNLVKGAAGQALQNMNLMLGCEESAGLA
jgi:N-acetyl-gamma-glutamyl-phosphate reductase